MIGEGLESFKCDRSEEKEETPAPVEDKRGDFGKGR